MIEYKAINIKFENKILSPENLANQIKIQNINRPIVFTNGCFDIVHRGHVTYLHEAKSLGKILIVALNTDESVKKLGKDLNRPINNLEDRCAVIAAIESVDFVTYFSENTPLELIKALKPDILVKGGDWDIEQIVGNREVNSWGGSTYSIPFRHQTSTTKLIAKINNK
jgi:rfaE bifunctional protein nucleotidyltransferase chain/domain